MRLVYILLTALLLDFILGGLPTELGGKFYGDEAGMDPNAMKVGGGHRRLQDEVTPLPTPVPSPIPTALPTWVPSSMPTIPTSRPSVLPTGEPSTQPSSRPTNQPSSAPTMTPSGQPTSKPTGQPSLTPTMVPSAQPTSDPSGQPSSSPSGQPSLMPTSMPSSIPTNGPTSQPSGQPSSEPSGQPSSVPSAQPTNQPTGEPTGVPSAQPSGRPTGQPTMVPTGQPSTQPTMVPTGQPTGRPSGQPTSQPSSQPTMQPTSQPSSQPTTVPTGQPSMQPTMQPSGQPTTVPTSHPTTSVPTSGPSSTPTMYPFTSPPTNKGITTPPTSTPTASPTRNYDDYMYKTVYSLYNKAINTLSTEDKPDNASVVGSIYYDFLDYKGQMIFGGCDEWTDFRTKAVNLPFDNLYPSYVKAKFAIQNFNKGSLGYSQMEADCGDDAALASIFAALENTDVSKQVTVRCVSTTGVFHDWRVYTCNGNTIFCVDCKFACSDQACPGYHPSIVRSCRESGVCDHSLGAMGVFRFDIAQAAVYPALTNLAATTTDTTISITGTVEQTAIVYCAAIKYNTDGSFPGISSVYRVKKRVMSGNGVAYTQVTGIVDGTATAISMTIENVGPATDYRVLCYTEDAFQHGMDVNSVRNTYVDVTTTCCAGAYVTGKSFLTSGNTGPALTSGSFYVTIDAVPRVDIVYSLSAAVASSSDGCDGSKVSLSGTTAPAVYPSAFTFEADTNMLSRPFVVSDNGEGCFKLYLTETSGGGSYTTTDLLLHVVTAGTASPSAPALSSVAFSSSGMYLVATFSEATNRASGILVPLQGNVYAPFSCSNVVSFSGSGSATCQWISSTTLKAKLPITPSSNTGYATVGDTFTVLSGTVRAACQSEDDETVCDAYTANSALSFSITAGDTPIVPLVSLSVPTLIGACDSLIIDPSQSSGSGGRAWSAITWAMQAKDTTDTALTHNVTEFEDHLNTWYTTSTRSLITLPRSLIDLDDLWLPGGNRTLPVEQEISIILTLTNFLGQSSTGSATFLVSSDDLLPNVRINGPVQFSRYADQALTLYATGTIPSCNSSSDVSLVAGGLSQAGISVEYAWGTFREFEFIETLPSLSLDTKVFKLDAYSMLPGYRYAFTVIATITFGDYTAKAESQVVVDVQSRGVQAVISGGSNRTVSLADDYIYIDASNSRDLDYPLGYTGNDMPGLNYTWTCIEFSPIYGADCGVTLLGSFMSSVKIDNRQDRAGETGVATTFLVAGKAYMFTVEVFNKGDTTSSDSTSAVIYAIGAHKGASVEIELATTPTKYNFDERIRINATISANQKSTKPVVMQWACEDIGPIIANISLAPYQTKLQFGLQDELLYEYGIKANELSVGHTYTFVLTAGYMDVYKDERASTDDDILVLADSLSLTSVTLDIVINGPPSNGEFVVSPTSGIALNTSFGFDTYGWIDDEDDFPLTYGITCYRIGIEEDATIVSTMQEVQYFESTLTQGHYSQNYDVTCRLTAQDIYESQTSLTQTVRVNTNPYLSVDAAGVEEVHDYLTASLSDAFAASDPFAVWRTVTGITSLLNEVDCSAVPTVCWQLKRNTCSRITNTCGECYDGYIGIAGHYNSLCVLESALLDGEECSTGSQCYSGFCEANDPNEDDDDAVKYCQPVQKGCPNDCGTYLGESTGECVFYDGFAIGRTIIPEPVYANASASTDDGPVGPGNGIDDDYVFIDPNTSAPTFSPTFAPEPFLYHAIGNCSANNISCSAVCECEEGFWGMGCGVSNDTIRNIKTMREEMCTGLLLSMDIQDTTVDVVYGRVMTVKDIMFDLTQISDAAMTDCTQVLVGTIDGYPEVASDDGVLAELSDALSHILQVGLMLDATIKTKVLNALQDLSIAKQQGMVVGEDAVMIETSTYGATLSKIRFGGGNNIGEMTFTPPISESSAQSGILTNSITFSQREDFDETKWETDDYRWGTILDQDNSTFVDDDLGAASTGESPAVSSSGSTSWTSFMGLSRTVANSFSRVRRLLSPFSESEKEAKAVEIKRLKTAHALMQSNKEFAKSRNLEIVEIIPPAGYNLTTFNCTKNPTNCTFVSDEEFADTGYSTVIGVTVTQYYSPQIELVFHNSSPIELKTKFYEGETAAEQGIGNATVTLVMQNFVSEPYNFDRVETLMVACFPSEESYQETVVCANGLNSTVTCEGDFFYGQRVVSCPGYEDVPRCATFNSETNEYEVENRCKAVEWNSDNTTCECNLIAYEDADERRRLGMSSSLSSDTTSRHLANSEGNVLTYEFSSFMVVDATTWSSYYELRGVKFIESVVYDSYVLILVGALVFALGLGIFGFVRWDVREVFTLDDRYNDSPKVIPTIRTFESFFDNILPYEFHDVPWAQKFWKKLKEEHDWITMILPGNYHMTRDLRAMKWLMVMGKVLHYMIAATVLAQMVFMDDGRCQAYTTQDECITPRAIDTINPLCWWRAEERSCGFNPYTKKFLPVLACTIAIVALIAIPEKIHRFLVQQTKRFADRVYFGEGAEQTVDNELGDEMKDIQNKTTTILRAARLMRMKEEIDFVTPEEELARLLQVTSRFHWFPQKQFSSATNNIMLAVEREMRNFKYNAEEIGDARSASELFYHAIASSRSLIVKKLQRSRRRAEDMKYILARMNLDLHRDDYITRKFLADSLPGYRRLVAQHFFFAREESREALKSQPLWALKLSVACLLGYWFVGLFYVLYFGTQIGSYGVTLWMLAVVCALLQDIFLLQPLRIWAQFVLFTYSVSDELLALYECLRTRAKTLITRQKGIITNTRSLMQHFNPACRAARMYPHLPSSRLIMSINDFDLPVNHRLKSLVPTRNWDGLQPSIAGVEDPSPSFGTLAVLSRASPLLADVYSLVVIKGYQGLIMLKDAAIKWAFAGMAAFLFFIFSLTEPLQNAVMEVLLTIAANLFLLMFYFTHKTGNASVVLLVIFVSGLVVFYFWYDERLKLLERKDKKRRIAVRDALRARKYYKQYLEGGQFDPGEKARQDGIFFKEIGAFHRDTYQDGTGNYDDEESKLADHILREKGFLPFTATIAAPPDESDFGPDGAPKIGAVIGGGILAPEFYDNKAFKKPDPSKKGKREPYGVFSNAFAAPENKVVPVASDVDDVISIYSQETQMSKEAMLLKMRQELEAQFSVTSANKINEEETKGDVSSTATSTEVGILDTMTRGVSTLIGGVIPISWGRLEGKTPAAAAEAATEDGTVLSLPTGSATSSSGQDLKQNSLVSMHSTKFKPLEGAPVPSEKAYRHKKKHAKKRLADGSVVSAVEFEEIEAFNNSNVSQEVYGLDAAQSKRQNTMHGSLKSSMAVALVAANALQKKEKHANKGMPIDGAGHMIAVESQLDMLGQDSFTDGDGEGDNHTVGTFMSSHSGKRRSVHRNTERHKGDRKLRAATANRTRGVATATGDGDSVQSGGSRLNAFEKADGPGSLALDEKLSTRKYEEAAGATSSTSQLMLPLRDMLHELASLKVLNPEMASETLVPPGATAPRTDVMTTHTLKPGKRSKKLKDKSTTIIRAGAASIAGSGGNDDDEVTYSSKASKMSGNVSKMSEIDLLENDPMMKAPEAIGGGAKSSHQVIKEKGRMFEYKTIRSRKKKVVDRLIPDGYDSPGGGGGDMGSSANGPHPPLSSSPGGYAKSQTIHRNDPGPAPILPWRDDPDKKEIDVEHMVAPTGVYFVTPTNAPAPKRPVPPPKVAVKHHPAGQVTNEHLDQPKHPLFS